MFDYKDIIIEELLSALKECSSVMCCETRAEIKACDKAEEILMKYRCSEVKNAH